MLQPSPVESTEARSKIMKYSIDQTLSKAKRLAQKSQFELAEQLYNSVLAKFPGNKRAIEGLKALEKLSYNKWVSGGAMPPQQIDELFALLDQDDFQSLTFRGEALAKRYPAEEIIPFLLGLGYTELSLMRQAVDNFKKAIKINPNYFDAHFNLGALYDRIEKYEDAIASYNNALKIKPNDGKTYNNIGVVLQEMEQFDDAIDAFQKAFKIDPNNADAYFNMGNAQKEKDDIESALDSYQNALKINPHYDDAYLEKWDLLEKSNSLDELEISIKEARENYVKLPDQITYYDAHLKYRSKQYNKCYQLIETIDIDNIATISKTNIISLKAKCLREQNKFAQSFSIFVEMNEMVGKSLDYEKQYPQDYFDQIIDTVHQLEKLSDKTPSKRASLSSGIHPTFLIGFPRSGTTLLDTILRTHSRIDVVEEQSMVIDAKNYIGHEPTIENIENIENLQNGKLKTARNIYFAELAKHTNLDKYSCYIDKLPLNILQLPFTNQLFSEAKYILALRHPLDSILSCFMQNFDMNPAMANMLTLDRIVDFYCCAMHIFEMSEKRYSLPIHRIRYEDLVFDMKTEVSALLKFLDLNWEDSLTDYQTTALQRGLIKTASYSQVVQPIYKTASYRWKNYEQFLEKYFEKVEPWVTKFGYEL